MVLVFSAIILCLGSIMALSAPNHAMLRRIFIPIGMGLTATSLFLWVLSFWFEFGHAGPYGIMHFSSGGIYLSGARMTDQAYWGCGVARFPTIWFFGTPAMVPLVAGWIPVCAFAIPTTILRARTRREILQKDANPCPVEMLEASHSI